MRVLSVRPLHGPNVLFKGSVLDARVDCSVWDDAPPGILDEAALRFSRWLSGASSGIDCHSAPPANGRPLSLRAGRLLAEAVVALQAFSRTPVAYCRVCDAGDGICRLVVEFEEEAVARACLDAGCRLLNAAAESIPLDAARELEDLYEAARVARLGHSTGPIVAAARARGVPVRRIDAASLVQLGHGSKQRRIERAVTDRTGRIAEALSIDKERTKSVLREMGIPVPAGRVAATADDAWRTACAVGLPVAIKPRAGDYGEGVSLNLTTRGQVEAAARTALALGEEVVVERFAVGEQFRLLIVGETLVAASRRDPPRLTGDGTQTLLELIADANRDPRRGTSRSVPWWPIAPDDDTPQVLAEQGFALESIPAPGVEVVLSRIGRTSVGATATDVTDFVHPHVAAQCVAAVRLIGLDVAGVDLIARDISRPLEEQGGAILEINAEPSISLHLPPFCETRRPVCEAIVESMFPPGETGRIPLVVVTGRGDAGSAARRLTRLWSERGVRVGRASAEGLFLGDHRVSASNHATLAGTRALLLSPQIDAAVLERSVESLRDEGLGVDSIDAAIVSCAVGASIDRDDLPSAQVATGTIRAKGVLVVDSSRRTDDPALFFETLADATAPSVTLIETGADCSLGSACRKLLRHLTPRVGEAAGESHSDVKSSRASARASAPRAGAPTRLSAAAGTHSS